MALDTVSGAQLIKQLDAFGVLVYMQWRTYAICESTLGKVHAFDGLSEVMTGTVGVKQGCQLSPTILGFYINEFELHRDWVVQEHDRQRQPYCYNYLLSAS